VNITIVTGPWLPVPPVRGGAMSKTWYALAQAFDRAGHRVTLVARKYAGQPDVGTEGNLRFMRTRGFEQGRSVIVDLGKDLLYAANALQSLPAADILVTNDFWMPVLAGFFRRRTGAMVVCAARYPKGQYRLYGRATRIVAISTAVQSAIAAEAPGLAPRTTVIPLPVDTDALGRGEGASPPEKRTLLFVGRVHPEKGIELLVAAFSRLAPRFPDWRLRIVGPIAVAEGGGGERFDRFLRDRARAFDVEFGGPIFDASALAAEYRRAALFCYPSLADRGEAFGVAPLEAMAAGVPPVVSALECFGDFVRDGRNGWVFDHRGANAESALVEVLAQAMQDGEARRCRGESARADAMRFGYAAVAGQYLALFERILATG
jgi:glycosyltransferase involved in cell wall biosynthesis